MSTIRVYSKHITPKMAEEMLSRNAGNRKVTQSNVQFLYKQMANGYWKLTGDPIKFDDRGQLVDGQHRLLALIKSGKTLEMFIAENLDDGVFEVLDTGRTRTAGDTLSVMGYMNVNVLAGAARTIILLKNGYFADSRKAGRDARITNSIILDFIKKNPSLEDDIKHINTIYRGFRYFPSSKLAALFFIFSKTNQTKAEDFFNRYLTGVDLGEENPIRLLRERFIRDQQNKSKMPEREKMALIIKAWNLFATNKKVKRLELERGATFPKPI